MQLLNKTDMSVTVPLLGEGGETESVTIQPNGKVSIPHGLHPVREMPQIHVIPSEPEDDFGAKNVTDVKDEDSPQEGNVTQADTKEVANDNQNATEG